MKGIKTNKILRKRLIKFTLYRAYRRKRAGDCLRASKPSKYQATPLGKPFTGCTIPDGEGRLCMCNTAFKSHHTGCIVTSSPPPPLTVNHLMDLNDSMVIVQTLSFSSPIRDTRHKVKKKRNWSWIKHHPSLNSNKLLATSSNRLSSPVSPFLSL